VIQEKRTVKIAGIYMRAKDVKKPIREFNQKELDDYVNYLRYLRTIQETTTKAVKRKKTAKNTENKLDQLLKSMTDEQREQFLEKHLG
jgi:hypothetical protein